NFADIALARELVLGPREHALDAVEVVARREAVLRDQRLAFDLAAHSGCGVEDLAHSLPPWHAAATHCSIDSSAGLWPWRPMMLVSFAELVASRFQPFASAISRA